ncbi:unnamed protein product [Brugia pahangi]|uniref:Viral_Rep domain-containing protein n=1 Tax=Brugia pahangi TaxID=6280 RepID=A0A0N4T097_BRUPA|nr:unnamed protein product [Brugia pahangi]
MSSRAKSWTATIFYMEHFNSELLQRIGNGLEYAIIGKETCPTINRQHFQCYFKFNSAIRFNTLISKLPRTSHVEKAKGSPYRNFQYCSKETINEEIGTRPQPSRKRKATEEQSQLLKKYCDNEMTINEIIQYDNIFVMRNLSRIQQLKSYITKDRTTTIEQSECLKPKSSNRSDLVFD